MAQILNKSKLTPEIRAISDTRGLRAQERVFVEFYREKGYTSYIGYLDPETGKILEVDTFCK